jgi:carboxypeptidase PM20D1
VKRFFAFLLALITIVIAIVLVRTAMLESKQIRANPAPPLTIDRDAAVARLSEAVKIRTVSSEPVDRLAFIAFLQLSYPRVHQQLHRRMIGNDALLYTWPGSDPSLKPALIMGHYDTVPVEPAALAKWTKPPFSGAVADGFVWGRGTLDDKTTVISLFEAAEQLLAQGHRPKRTIYFAFGGDEEIGGRRGAAEIAKHLAAQRVQLDAVIDEGGAIMLGTVAGTTKPVALIGIAEKGSATVELLARGSGGHSSMPPHRTEVGTIAAAVDRVQRQPFDAGVGGASAAMFRWLAPELAFERRLVLANLWLFEPLLAGEAKRLPSFNAMMRTTTAPTIISGGVKDNVMPTEARAVLNFRILPGDSVQKVVEHVKGAVDDPHIQVRLVEGWEPSPVSDPDAPQLRALQTTIAQTFPDAVVTPYLVVGATDARWFRSLTPNIYRFMPVTLTQKDLERVHGIDERLAIDAYVAAIRFYRTLIVNM